MLFSETNKNLTALYFKFWACPLHIELYTELE